MAAKMDTSSDAQCGASIVRAVFIHGAFSRDGAWWWTPAAALLRSSGIASTTVALPSCGETGIQPTGVGPTLYDDAAAATAVLDEGEPTILVAHSYGGMVASQAGDHPAVRHLVYITSFLPAVGETLAAISSAPDPVPVLPHADGSVSVDAADEAAFNARVLQDVDDPELVRGAHDRLCAQSSAVFGAPATKAAWERIRSTYLVCAEERSTPPDLQRAQAARATTVHELPAGHFPFLSHPELVAACIEETARRAG
jgi:pimeloyl-ACP methyl ester carboxylesterase